MNPLSLALFKREFQKYIKISGLFAFKWKIKKKELNYARPPSIIVQLKLVSMKVLEVLAARLYFEPPA